MKKILFASALFLGTISLKAAATPEVNQKVLKAFAETFKNPTDVAWHEYPSYYEVDFSQDEIKTQVRYDSDGNIIGTTRYYFENELPPFILSKLQKKYPGRTVYGVTEIYSDSDLTYYITMQDDKNWFSIKASPLGLFEQTEKYKKAPNQ